MIEVPARELAGRDAAGNRVEQPEHAFGARTAPLENGVMHHFVQQHGEVEHREALYDRERHPDQRMVEPDERPGRRAEDGELSERDREMPCRPLPVQLAHLGPGDGGAELRPQRARMLRVVVRFHGPSIVRPKVPSRASATPASTAEAPAIFVSPSGSCSQTNAVIIAMIGSRFEYTDVRALPISRTAVYQMVYETQMANTAEYTSLTHVTILTSAHATRARAGVAIGT